MYPEVEADFLNHAPRDLPLHYLQDWFSAAWDPPHVSKEIWMHLLPRILDVLAAGDEPATVGIETALKRFPCGDSSQWNDEQWDVLRRFRVGFVDRYRSLNGHDDLLDDVLCMFGLARFSLDDLCNQVWDWSDAELIHRLHHDWFGTGGSIWISFFWDGDLVGQTHRFYTSERMLERMTSVGVSADGPLADKALAIADAIMNSADHPM